MYKRILVPTDGTELCTTALDAALALAQAGGGSILGLHAGPPERLNPLAEEDPVRAAWLIEREQAGDDALAWVAPRRRSRRALRNPAGPRRKPGCGHRRDGP
jgi:nucleotide-binding universal stress UspA family protein